jgi:hypothetical protein
MFLLQSLRRLVRGSADRSLRRRSDALRDGSIRARLQLEPLEDRRLLSTLLYLDFDGCTQAEEQLAVTELPGWRTPQSIGPQGELSFLGEFNVLNTQYGGYSKYSFLDENHDGVLDRTDADILAGHIMARVRQQYSDFDVQVIRMDSTAGALLALHARQYCGYHGDSLIYVTGWHDGSGGQSHLDLGNTQDDVGGAGCSVGGARYVVDSMGLTGNAAREAFINLIANMISHEAGHTFGLQHVDASAPGAQGYSIMTPTLDGSVCTFQDKWFHVDGQPSNVWQNEHLTLLQNLGASGVVHRAEVTLRAYDGQYVCAEGGGGGNVDANRNWAYTWENFDILYLPDGHVALEAANGQYVSAEGGGGGDVHANRDAIGSWEEFMLEYRGYDRVAFRTANGYYLCAEGGGGQRVVANRTAAPPGGWEEFHISSLWENIQLYHSSYYWTAEGGGGQGVVANRTVASGWEYFDAVFLGNNQVAFRAYDGKYVSAEGGGGGAVNANRDFLQTWETFTMVDRGQGYVSFQTSDGSHYLCDEGGGGQQVVANRTAAPFGGWETFLISVWHP